MVNGKKLLASILVGAMVITGSPVAPAWSVASVEAAEKTVLCNGGYYDTIANAILNNKTNAKIELTADHEEDLEIKTGTVTLDLGGFTLKSNIKGAGKVDFTGEGGTVVGTIDTQTLTNSFAPQTGADKPKTGIGYIKSDKTMCIKVTTQEVDGVEVPVSYSVAKHEYRPTFTWKETKVDDEITGYTAKQRFSCNNGCCADSDMTDAIIVEDSTTYAPTCKTSGKKIFKVSVSQDGKTYTDQRELAVAKLDHDYSQAANVEWDVRTNSDYSKVYATATFKCSRSGCGTQIPKTADVKIIKSTPATCVKAGILSYTATVVGPDGKTYTKSEVMTPDINDKAHTIEITNDCKKKKYEGDTWVDDATGSNYVVEFADPTKNDAKPNGTIKAEIKVTHCAECGHPLTTPVVYDTLTFDAKSSTKPVHELNNVHGTVEKYTDINTAASVVISDYFAGVDGHPTATANPSITITKALSAFEELDVDDGIDNNLSKGSYEINGTTLYVTYDIDKPEHQFDKTERYIAPTCKDYGYVTGVCSICDEKVENKRLDKLPHTYTDLKKYIPGDDATCTTEGTIYYICDKCGDASTPTKIPALGHKYSAVNTATASAVANDTPIYVRIQCENGCNEVIGQIYVKPNELTKKVNSCTEKVVYTIPADVNDVTNEELDFTSTDENGAHTYKATWEWDEKSYDKPHSSLVLTCTNAKCKDVDELKTNIIPSSEIEYKVVAHKATCERAAYKEVTATAKDQFGNVYTDKKELESDVKTSHKYGEPDATGYITDERYVKGDFENEKIEVTCETCKETKVLDAKLVVSDDGLRQTLTATEGSVAFKAFRELKNITVDDAKTVWVEKTRLENVVPYFTYGANPTNVILYSKAVVNAGGNVVTPSEKLIKGKDYTIEIDSKNVGVRTVTVKGIGKYTGTVELPVVIEKKAVTITLPNVQNTTNALPSSYKATVSGVVAGDSLNVKPVLSGSVIKATYDDNGNYDVTVKEGKLTVVKSAKKAQSITTTKLSASYKVATVKKAAKTFSIGAKCTSKTAVTAKKVSGSKKITVTSTGKVKIAKGTKKGTYTAQVKLSAKATSSYKAATKTVKVTVKVK